MTDDLKEVMELIRALREDIAALRADRAVHYYSHQGIGWVFAPQPFTYQPASWTAPMGQSSVTVPDGTFSWNGSCLEKVID